MIIPISNFVPILIFKIMTMIIPISNFYDIILYNMKTRREGIEQLIEELLLERLIEHKNIQNGLKI
ncbi:hypothetical protein H8356DRAFT_1431592 [Neocallimastix lanati (nom. inval.)]|nr:hypothetical protein H8356DRAFT_1431592 [Neocallimastix sp. JGI-2020a]